MRTLFLSLAWVATATAARAQIPATRFTLTRDLRIDGVAEDLVPIGAIAVGRDGTIALTQGQDHAVRFYDATGKPSGRIGRDGQGPGEFSGLSRIGWVGDTLWVLDNSQKRVSLISPQRTFVRSFSVASAQPAPADAARLPRFGFVYPRAVYSGGVYLATGSAARDSYPPAYDTTTTPVFRASADGVVQRIVARHPRLDSFISVSGQGFSASARIPFRGDLVEDIAVDGSIIATAVAALSGPGAGTFRVTALGAQGDTIFSRTYPYVGVPIPNAVFDTALESAIARASRMRSQLGAALLANAKKPPVYEPLNSMLVGRDGSIWIRLRTTADGRPWLVLSAKGDPLGLLMQPENMTIRAVDLEHVWATEADADDIQSIVRYHVGRGG